MTMSARFAIPFIILAVLFLPLPFVVSFFLFGVVLAVRPRGEPCRDPAVISRFAGRTLLRSPPR
jgi:hypothetical protein